MAKPDWQSKRRDGDRGRNHVRNYREPVRDNAVLLAVSGKRPNGVRREDTKAQVAKQGVNGALRAANLRLLLEKAPVREVLALVAEVPLERLEAISQGTLCPDETAFHIERTLKLPGKWLDGLNNAVPERTLELLKHPDQAGLQDDEESGEGAVASLSAVASVASRAASRPVRVPARDADAQQAPGADAAAPARLAPSRTATAEAQLPLSMAVPRPYSGPKENFSMASPELRKQNLSILLHGKGAKSALARVLQVKPPYVSAMLSGRKVLDQELCGDMARALGLPNDWFEAARSTRDIPAATLQRLAPLPRDAATDANAASAGEAAEAGSAPSDAGGTSSEGATDADTDESAGSLAGAAEGQDAALGTGSKAVPATGMAQRRRGASRRGSEPGGKPADPVSESSSAHTTTPVQAELLAPVEPEAQPTAPLAAPARPAEVVACAAPASDTAPVEASVSPGVHSPVPRSLSFTPVLSQSLVIEGGLAPIAEALIKTLVLKAKQGDLSEDKAFELLGAVRLL
ncbi:helix-turn-helix domain-containing protein [Azohydromonas caseinilytica]|uniref:Helix-turn-helix transcriptional regulator n=1 Tax=Azohydromonas caseinilytica TaxID=2728836 RepID=A0A848FI53_9BURK|nr:helix-turn-helix transcriptional regulator [Azohydromonas caseinilytica]NML17943.1 helix-turn-helix transcriptional regulator [Azohydromonas caseinilytica]